MATIYAEDWAPGNSLFTESGYAYSRTIDGVDPLYPYVRSAEGVYINGDGRLDKNPTYTGEFETYQQAGIWVKGPGALNGGGPGMYSGSGFWNAAAGCLQATYYPTTESLNAWDPSFTSAPLCGLVKPDGTTVNIGVDAQLEDAYLVIYHQNEGSHDQFVEITGAPMPVAGEVYNVRIGWQCGTYDPEEGIAAADGFVKLWINDELIYEAADISLFLSKFTSPENLVDSAIFGYFGMIGPLDSFTIADSECASASPIVFHSGRTSSPVVFSKILLKVVE